MHDALTLASVVLLVGHLYLALIHPSTRHALRGMTTGEVDESWARKHHPKWVGAENRPPYLRCASVPVGRATGKCLSRQ